MNSLREFLHEEPGSGQGFKIQKPQLEQFKVYQKTWQGLFFGPEALVVNFGAGPATREWLYGIQDGLEQNLDFSRLSPAVFVDIVKKVPKLLQKNLKELAREIPTINDLVNYQTDVDLNDPNYVIPWEKIDVVIIHGLIPDYLTPKAIENFLHQLEVIRPEQISMRVLLLTDSSIMTGRVASTTYPDLVQRQREGLLKLRDNKIRSMSLETLINGIKQLIIPPKELRKTNLFSDYPASHFPDIDQLAGWLTSLGYELTLEPYSFKDNIMITDWENPQCLLLFAQQTSF